MTDAHAIAIVCFAISALFAVAAFALHNIRRKLERARETLLRIRGYFR